MSDLRYRECGYLVAFEMNVLHGNVIVELMRSEESAHDWTAVRVSSYVSDSVTIHLLEHLRPEIMSNELVQTCFTRLTFSVSILNSV